MPCVPTNEKMMKMNTGEPEGNKDYSNIIIRTPSTTIFITKTTYFSIKWLQVSTHLESLSGQQHILYMSTNSESVCVLLSIAKSIYHRRHMKWVSMEQWWNNPERKTGELGERSVPVALCPLQVSHRAAWDWTRVSAVQGRRLTAWAISRPHQWPSTWPDKYPRRLSSQMACGNNTIWNHGDIHCNYTNKTVIHCRIIEKCTSRREWTSNCKFSRLQLQIF
jgi:hypothetical protein